MNRRRRRRPTDRPPRQLESLEDRRLLAADWTNSANPWDVNRDQVISADDALTVLHELRDRTISDPWTATLPARSHDDASLPFLDVNGDSYVSALDALLVVNRVVELHEGPAHSKLSCSPIGIPTLTSDQEPPHGSAIAQISGQSISPLALADYQSTAGGSVFVHSGEALYRNSVLAIPGRGFNWTFDLTYRSGVDTTGPVGANWRHNYERNLVEVNAANLPQVQQSFPIAVAGDVVRSDGYGRVDLYQQFGSDFISPAGYFTKLVLNGEGSYTEFDEYGNRVDYAIPDPSGAARMLNISDRNDNTMTFSHDVTGCLESVTDTLGRSIQYSYDAGGRLQAVTDYGGRSITLSYDANGDLEAVTTPIVVGTPHGNDFPEGKTERYTYSSGFREPELNHNLLSVEAPNEVAQSPTPMPRMVFTYETLATSVDFDRVTSVAFGGTNTSAVPAGGTVAYAYSTAPKRTLVTDRNGNDTEYEIDGLERIVSVKEFSNRNLRSTDPVFFETTYMWNNDSLPTSVTRPENNPMLFTYDDTNPDRRQQGNLIAMEQLPGVRSGDQASIRTTLAYEPIFNQVYTLVEPRGNDTTYVPQNGGLQSAERYTTTFTFDYQEGSDFAGLGAKIGLTATEVQQLLTAAGLSTDLGDLNGDTLTDQIAGNAIQVAAPTVNLLVDSNQAAVEGDPLQEIVEIISYNHFGQTVRQTDPELNVTEYAYYSEQDPDGDGIINNPSGHPTTGGYLQQVSRDTVSDSGRNSNTNPTPTNIRTGFEYDTYGNATRLADGRGIATDFLVNQLNQVVQIIRASEHDLFAPDPVEPVPLVDFRYVQRIFYDHNDNVVRRQVEDRGNTSNVGIQGDIDGDNDVDADDIDELFDALGEPADLTRDLQFDGVLDMQDVDYLVERILRTFYGDANLDSVVDGQDFIAWNANKFSSGTGWATADFTGDTLTDGQDFIVWNGNKFTAGQTPLNQAFVDYTYSYDILDDQIEIHEEVSDSQELVTRIRYDANTNPSLTIFPEGNASSAIYDERDLLLTTTRGATLPPTAANLGPSDPSAYDQRGGIAGSFFYHYDGNANLIETVDADDTDQSTDNNSDISGDGDRTRYIWDGFDRLTSRIDSVGNQQVYQYDPADNVVRRLQFGPVGGPTPTSDGPDILGFPVSVGGVIQSTNLVTSNLLAGHELLYDELSRQFQLDQVLFVNTVPTLRSPDVADGATDLGKGNLTPGDNQTIPGVGGVVIDGRVSTRHEFDRKSRLTFTVQDDVDTTRIFFDGADRVIQTLDPEGNTVEYAYDDSHNLIEKRDTDVAQITGVPDEIFLTTFFYDAVNRVQQQVDNIGQSSQYRYDSRDNLVATADAQGPLSGTFITRRAFSGGALTVDAVNDFGNVTRHEYDGISRPTRTEIILTTTGLGDGIHIGASLEGVKDDPGVSESFPPAADVLQGGGDGVIRIGTAFDDNSLVSSRIDDQGNVTLYLYDNLNRQVTETQGLTTGSGPLTKTLILGPREVITPTSAAIDNPAMIPTLQIDTQLQEAETRLTALASLFPPLADQIDDNPPTTTAYGYDPDSNLLIREDQNDSELFTRYDAINRAIAVRIFRSGQSDSHMGDPMFAPNPVSDPSNPSTVFPAVIGTTKQNFEYDGLSRLVFATDDNDPTDALDDATVTFAFDSLSRVIEETQQTLTNPVQAISSGWRAANLRSTLVYPNTRELTFTYDDLDRLNTIDESSTPTSLVDYSYIGKDRVLERLFPINGTRMTYLDSSGATDIGYDGLRRTVQLSHVRSDNSIIVGFAHTYDRMNNKLTESKLHDPINDEVYTYDSAYRQLDFDRPNAGAITPEHSSFALDGAGNWTSVDSESREHSSLNEITLRDDGTATTLAYDDNGNLTDDGTHLYEWDAFNRLSQITRKSGGLSIAGYTYDAAGRRVAKSVPIVGGPDEVTIYHYDGPRVIEERTDLNQLTQQYVYGNYVDEVLIVNQDLDGDGSATGTADRRLFYHHNSMFSVYALVDDAALITEGYLYDAYGRQTVYAPGTNGVVNFGGDDTVTVGGSSLVGNPYLFTGRRLDTESGLYYYRSRYLDTSLGRFISRDTIGVWSDVANRGNGYAYVGNAPTQVSDPFGTATIVVFAIRGVTDDSQENATPENNTGRSTIITQGAASGGGTNGEFWFTSLIPATHLLTWPDVPTEDTLLTWPDVPTEDTLLTWPDVPTEDTLLTWPDVPTEDTTIGIDSDDLDYLFAPQSTTPVTVVVFSVRGITDESQSNSSRMAWLGIDDDDLDYLFAPQSTTAATVVVFSVRGITDESQSNSSRMAWLGIDDDDLDYLFAPQSTTAATVVVFSVRGITDDTSE